MATRGIDHLVLPVRDLDRAREIYTRMGFTLTPPARHPWGTANSLVQFDRCFLEILAVADQSLIREHGSGSFSFGAFNRDFLSRREGFSMLVLESADARADTAEFAKAGLKTYRPFDFSRKAVLPSGEEVTVAFSLAFTSDPNVADAGFFTCQQHAPEHFWKPDYQRHANSARTITGVVMTSADPASHEQFLLNFSGAKKVRKTQNSLTIDTPRGRIAVLTPRAARSRYGDTIVLDPRGGVRFVAYHVGVTGLAAARAALKLGRIPFRDDQDMLSVAAADAFGVAIVLEEL